MNPEILKGFPDFLEEWDLGDVNAFLIRINLSSVTDIFKKKMINGKKYQEIDEKGFQALGISSIKSKKLRNWCNFIKENTEAIGEENADFEIKNSVTNGKNRMNIKLVTKNEKKIDIPETHIITSMGFKFMRMVKKNIKPENWVMMDDDTISGKHAEIIFAGNCFLLGDEGSENGTFFHISKGKKLVLEKDMRIEMGNTEFIVKDMKKTKVLLVCKSSEEESKESKFDLKFTKTKEVYTIGKDKNIKNEDHYIYVEDDLLENEQATIKYEEDNFVLVPKENKYGVWLNLKQPEEEKKFYLILEKNSMFRISTDYHYKVTDTMNESLPDCNTCKSRKSNVVFMPCKHICSCFECALKAKKCPMKNCKEIMPKKIRILNIS